MTDAPLTASHVRLYADSEGESHFEDLTTELEPQAFAPPAPPLHVAPMGKPSALIWVAAPRGWGGDAAHPAPQRQVFVTIRGTYEVTASDGSVRSFPPGSVLLLEDTSGKGHRTRITDGDNALVLGVVL